MKTTLSAVEAIALHAACTMVVILLLSSLATASNDGEGRNAWHTKITENTASDTTLLLYGQILEPTESSLNPGNSILNINRYAGTAQIRNETKVSIRALTLDISPRLTAEWKRWETGPMEDQSDSSIDIKLAYWRTGLMPDSRLSLSYGRENLQWGPSYLFSPSNPYFGDNGKKNPRIEVAGMNFARVVYIPSLKYSFSLIYNDTKGDQDIAEDVFSKSLALKVDAVEDQTSWSGIVARNEAAHWHIGGYCNWTASQALIVYGEGAVNSGCNIKYPVTSDNALGYDFQLQDDDNDRWVPSILAGSSYTLLCGPTLVLEYLYYGRGYDSDQRQNYYRLRSAAENLLTASNQDTTLAYSALGRAADTGLIFLGRNYLMLQIHQAEYMNILDYSIRWVHNLDDGSNQFTVLTDLYIGAHLIVFTASTLHSGAQDTEFMSYVNYTAMAGIEYRF